jgi:transposase
MRGDEKRQEELFACGSLGQRVPAEHPLRRIRAMTDAALGELKAELAAMYAGTGRPSIPPEQMLRALLLQMLFSVRSERMLVEQMEYNLLFRWFVGLGWDGGVWDASSFSKNRERLLAGEMAAKFFRAVVEQARAARLLSDERFTVDGTLIEAWASEKSYVPRIGPRGPRGSGEDGKFLLRDTHVSKTDPEAGMYRKSLKTGWRLQHMAHAVSENQHGLVVATAVSRPSPRAEREQALVMIRRLGQHTKIGSVGADKGYHERDFVEGLNSMGASAHVPPYAGRRRRRCWIDPHLPETVEFRNSQKRRKWIERFFSWLKNTAGLRKTRHRGHRNLDWNFTFAAAAYNLVRITKLLPAA